MLLHKELINFGLAEYEAQIYLTVLQLGKASIQEISTRSGINRPTVYSHLELLMRRGIIKTGMFGKRLKYLATPPEEFIEVLIKEQERRLVERKKLVSKVLPDLNKLLREGYKAPVVRYFEGAAGVKLLVKEILTNKEKDTLRVIYPYELLVNFLSDREIEDAIDERKRFGIDFRAIYTADYDVFEDPTRYRRLSPEDFPISCDIGCYGEQIRIISFKEPFTGIIIINRELADNFKRLFDYIFNSLEA